MSYEWYPALQSDALKEGGCAAVEVDGERIALFRVQGRVFATQDACPHEGISLGCGGKLHGHTVACGLHHWEFDIRDGHSVDGCGDDLILYPIEERDAQIWVGLLPADDDEEEEEAVW